jgi:hypothetical protein
MKDIVETMMKENDKTKDASAEMENGVEDSRGEASVDMTRTAQIDQTAEQGEEDPTGTSADAEEAESAVLIPSVSSRPQSTRTATLADESRVSADYSNRMNDQENNTEDDSGDRDMYGDSNEVWKGGAEALHDGSSLQNDKGVHSSATTDSVAGQDQEVPDSNKDQLEDSDEPVVTFRSPMGDAATAGDEHGGEEEDENEIMRDLDSASKTHDGCAPHEERCESPLEKNATGDRSALPATRSKRIEKRAKQKKSSNSARKLLWRSPVSLQSVPTVVSLLFPFGPVRVRGQQR